MNTATRKTLLMSMAVRVRAVDYESLENELRFNEFCNEAERQMTLAQIDEWEDSIHKATQDEIIDHALRILGVSMPS